MLVWCRRRRSPHERHGAAVVGGDVDVGVGGVAATRSCRVGVLDGDLVAEPLLTAALASPPTSFWRTPSPSLTFESLMASPPPKAMASRRRCCPRRPGCRRRRSSRVVAGDRAAHVAVAIVESVTSPPLEGTSRCCLRVVAGDDGTVAEATSLSKLCSTSPKR